MTRFLLVMILVALLFGSGAAFAVLELGIIAYGLLVALILLASVVLLLAKTFSKPKGVIEYHPMRQKAPHVPGYQFRDMGDYLDWANYRGRWSDRKRNGDKTERI